MEPAKKEDAAVHAILLDWADWQRRYRVFVGYPRRSCGVDAGGQVVTPDTSEEQQDDAMQERCRIADGCIDDLHVPAQRAAIHRRYLCAVYRMRDYEAMLADAIGALSVAFKRKGIMF